MRRFVESAERAVEVSSPAPPLTWSALTRLRYDKKLEQGVEDSSDEVDRTAMLIGLIVGVAASIIAKSFYHKLQGFCKNSPLDAAVQTNPKVPKEIPPYQEWSVTR